tara:strand:- start:207 stop:800 length:594 start_codon:yes stop_codon:yes gene_type:complete
MKSSLTIYLIGAGGYGKQILSILKDDEYKINPILVDDKLRLSIKKFKRFEINTNYNITIGNIELREKIYKILKKKNLLLSNIILNGSKIYTDKIGKGSIIEPHTMICNDVKLGISNFILTGSSIGHNTKIGNFCNVGCNVAISGNVKIGKNVVIGGQSFISNDISICDNVVISPGSTVLSDIKKPGVYNGNLLVKKF